MKKAVSLTILLFTFLLVEAQKAPFKFGDIPIEDLKMKVYEKDSSAEAVILGDFGESSMNYTENNGFQITFTRMRRIKILTKEGLDWAKMEIGLYHDSDQEEKLSNMKVVTYNLENGKTIETKAKSDSYFKEKYDENINIMKIAWPNVVVGSVLEISYSIVSDFIFNFQDWEFQSKIPVRLSEYRARIPEYFYYEKYMQGYVGLSINETSSNASSIILNTKTSSNSLIGPASEYSQDKIDYQENRFRWVAKDVPAFKNEPFITSSNDYISKLNFELAYTKYPNSGIKNYMGSWEDISKSYWESVGAEIKGNGSLKNIVEPIIASLSTPEEKIAAIHAYVKQNVLWDGTQRKYNENSPKKTLDQKKGSSAEINLLLACLLEKADIVVSPVLLSTRNHGFVRETMAISSQFNYMACVAKVGDKNILLDATDKLLPPGVLPESCLNGNGLVISKDGFQWINLKPTVKTKTYYDATITLTDAGELKGTLKIDKTGYSSTRARKSYLLLGEQEYLKKFIEGRQWTLNKSQFQNVQEIHQPFKETHDIVVTEHIAASGDIIYFNPFIISKENENPFKAEKRDYPVDFGNSYDQMYMARITIPDGYQVEELPKSKVMALPENSARYIYNIAQTGNTINFTSGLTFNRSLFTQDEYLGLKEFYNQVVAKQAEQIVLKKR
jgi:hypothetical protein